MYVRMYVHHTHTHTHTMHAHNLYATSMATRTSLSGSAELVHPTNQRCVELCMHVYMHHIFMLQTNNKEIDMHVLIHTTQAAQMGHAVGCG